jgi:hypothetical protein
MCRLDFEGMSRDAVRARAEREREEESLEDMASGGGDPDFMTVSCLCRIGHKVMSGFSMRHVDLVAIKPLILSFL